MIGLEIVVPEIVVAGSPTEVAIRLSADRDHAVRALVVRVVERQACGVLTDKREHAELRTRFLDDAPVCGEVMHRFAFTLPADEAPTHRTGPATVGYEIVAELDLPWRADLRATRELVVCREPDLRAPETEEHLEAGVGLALGTRGKVFAVGDLIVGAFTIYGATRPDDVEVALVAVVTNSDGLVARVPCATMRVAIPPRQFRTSWKLVIPSDLPPTCATRTHRVTWQLVADERVVLPIELVPGAVPLHARHLHAPGIPSAISPIDDPEFALVFRQLTETDGAWQCDGRAEATTEIGAVRAQLAIERRERLILIARVQYPRLGLGLPQSSTPAEAGRFSDAVTSAVRAIAVARIAAFDDHHLLLEKPIARLDRARLQDFARRVIEVVRAIVDATATIAPRFPARDHAAWHAFAAELRGSYAPADGCILGEVGIMVGARDGEDTILVLVDDGRLRAELPAAVEINRIRRMVHGLRALAREPTEPYR